MATATAACTAAAETNTQQPSRPADTPTTTTSIEEESDRKSAPWVPTQEDLMVAISMLPNVDPTTSHTCDGCSKDLTALCYIRCAECTSQPHDVDLCAECFATGQEPINHKKTHKYRVMDKLSEKVFCDEWTAAEELSLLDQVKRHGLGAWEDISESKLFYRHKTASEICAHYLDTYLCRFGSVLPPFYLNHREDGTVERVPIPPTGPDPHDPLLRGVEVKSGEIRSRTIAELGTNPQFRYEASWETLARKKAEALAAKEAAAAKEALKARKAAEKAGGGEGMANGAAGGFGSNGNGAAGGPDGDSSGVAKEGEGISNGDAETGAGGGRGGAAEFKNSVQSRKRKRKAQQTSRNKEEERQIKEWVESLPGADLGGYFPLRGDFEVEHDNAAEELLANMEFRPTDHASERQLKLDVIAVYNHRLDERERRKRFVIEHNLLDYKKPLSGPGGKKRLKEDRELISRLRPFARFHSAEEHEELIDNLLLAKKMRARIEQLQTYRENGITTLAEGQEFELAKKRRQEELLSKKHREAASYLFDTHGKGSNKERSNRYSNRANKDGSGAEGDGSSGEGDANLMDLTNAPGVEYLSPAERSLCSQLHILPGYYLVVKDAMIQECARSGCLKRKNISGLAVMDSSRLDKMYDFFVTCGWVSEHMQQDLTYHATNQSANSS